MNGSFKNRAMDRERQQQERQLQRQLDELRNQYQRHREQLKRDQLLWVIVCSIVLLGASMLGYLARHHSANQPPSPGSTSPSQPAAEGAL